MPHIYFDESFETYCGIRFYLKRIVDLDFFSMQL